MATSNPPTPKAMADASPDTVMGEEVPQQTNNGKRKAEDELERGAKRATPSDHNSPAADKTEDAPAVAETPTTSADANGLDGDTPNLGDAPNPLSKNQLKKQRRREAMEARKEDRTIRRREKRHQKQARKREATEAQKTDAAEEGVLNDSDSKFNSRKGPLIQRPVPIAFILDCDFEKYMREPELVSLASQITRSYSQTRKARFQAHLYVTGWGGKLKERFETTLKGQHERWRGCTFVDAEGGDFRDAGRMAKEVFSTSTAAENVEAWQKFAATHHRTEKPAAAEDDKEAKKNCRGEADLDETVDDKLIYLTSDSPYTLERLEPYHCYVVGGLVDRNREKGLCYRRACERKVRTAKLPIGEYMAMQSRYVLTTNQVIEIMAKWLECGDWGDAFISVIPKRKGGVLKTAGADEEGTADRQDEAAGEDEGVAESEEVAVTGNPQKANGADADEEMIPASA